MTDGLSEVETALETGNSEQARGMLRVILKENPTAEAYYLASKVSSSSQQRKQFLERTLELDPFHPTASDELAELQESSQAIVPATDSNIGGQQAGVVLANPAPADNQVNVTVTPEPRTPAVAVVKQKSGFVAFLLTFFFGPLGMLYSTVVGALVMLVVSVLLALVTGGLSLPITWIICIIWGVVAATKTTTVVVN